MSRSVRARKRGAQCDRARAHVSKLIDKLLIWGTGGRVRAVGSDLLPPATVLVESGVLRMEFDSVIRR
eukprot:519609-Pyramimonas_sp.AAC.1